MENNTRTLLLFDVDGTLTASRQIIKDDMADFMVQINKKVCCGLVGGSDLEKITEQMGGKEALHKLDYVFAENGLAAYKKGETIAIMSLIKKMGEEKLQELINYALGYLANLKLPAKRGTFVEFRNGMINFCPVGRSCSQEERNVFGKLDQEENIRGNMVKCLREKFSADGWVFSIGGQISIDAYPDGWDKRYCLQYVEKDFDTIHFFGDKVEKGGNDHEIYSDPRTIGHKVVSPEDTKKQVSELLGMN
ncbi:phosphomannomutase 2-like [Asterias rubens]|uniref:phosphomannomutase 2-like n=1 Tax=Asterias rubens TaxID=7604 RepID=UPI0014558274|nr:phosphomannomutase 2-like [Asterias rubens]